MSLILHNFFRSSASVRVRAALHLKGIDYEHKSYVLREHEHKESNFLGLNPQGLVPALELNDGTVLTQSLVIMEYLDDAYPRHPLVPADRLDKAWVKSLACNVACDLHPLNNLRVLQYIGKELNQSEETVSIWFRHWVNETFTGLEQQLANDERRRTFCYGHQPGLADICLFAQVANNRRFNVDMTPYPIIESIYERCLQLPEFVDALPEKHPHAS
ncbi:maleylacetoacetate isomerase [Natronospirillum operosum]|uniref:Maleylacetoacetate isomerase n=1 Tax=Natronospirillum operosum TaxID=2759953 RepID=A0A4Z0WH11_9GAMM|nr:maleylacetoacetate isomerase [Natronospirillum operosum]TGG95046.1 maleylacetoacetate isomerase [Natronospirillum operosum]